MVVLSIGLLAKNGKVLVARQYVDMTRIRIEGILAAFPKLIESGTEGSSSSKQHTYVETGSIRYVYQPIEGMYLVLVTTRGSNIVQDLDTLRLLSKVVPEYSAVTEEEIARNVFDLIFAFDEVITLGYKENIDLEGIRTNLEMDSHNEKLHMLVQQSKMNDAKDEARRKAAAIKASKQQMAAAGMGGGGGSGMTGFGNSPSAMDGPSSSSSGFGSSSSSSSSSGFGNDGFGSSSSSSTSKTSSGPSSDSKYGQSAPTPATSTGMKLGKGMKIGSKAGKGMNIMQQMAKEEDIDLNAIVQQQSAKANVAAPGAVVRSDPIEVRISEGITVIYDKDGALHKVEVKGTISLLCHEESVKARLQLEYYGDSSSFQFQPHPNLNRDSFTSNNILEMKNLDRGFPKEKALSILKWRYSAKEDETMVPLKVTVWPESNGDGTMTVNLEMELMSEHVTLQNVLIIVPLASSDEPEIVSIEGGLHRHNTKKHQLEWELSIVDKENSHATMEFVTTANDEADFFPSIISFTSEDTICPIHVSQVESVDNAEPQKFGLYRQLQTEKYEIVAQID